ncbi:MAG: hypothetical protein IJ814_08895 [Paludibacteraceae bacterium]|nr:hypothetical protein [Paludibacteraceae bacterium]
MRKRFAIILLFFVLASCAYAETIVLRTGARVKGEIVFQNEEVVIVRDPSGARSQYPRAEIAGIEADAPAVTENQPAQAEPEMPVKKVSILLELAGGAGIQPKDTLGGAFSVDFLVGSHHIRNRHIFAGAGVGYHGLFLGGAKYNFLPLQVAVRMPFMEQKHAPMFGVAVGYGIALSRDYVGGIYTGIDLGYRCQLNPNTALALTAFVQFQQARITATEWVPVSGTPDQQVAFTNTTGRNLLATGLKLSLYF